MSWTAVRLGDVVTLKRGHDLPESARRDGDVPVVSSSGITGYHDEARAKAPGVVTGRYGTLGEVYFVEEDYWPLNTALYAVDFRGNRPRFVKYLLQHVLRDYQSDKAAVPGVNRNVLHQIPVLCPEVHDQDRVVAVLAQYDALIENNRRRMALLEDAARQVYREWFVRLRFPGREHTPVSLGVPHGWERIPFGDALVLQRGFDLPLGDRRAGPVPVYGATGVVGRHDVARVKAPGVVTGRSGSLGNVQLTFEDYWPLNTALWVKAFKRISPWFAYLLLHELDLRQYNAGASVPTLDRNIVHAVEIVVPPLGLLGAFDEFARPVFSQINVLRSQNDRLRAARDLLLPRLMSGEIAL